MASMRAIRKIWEARPTIEGAGVHLKRAFGHSQVPLFSTPASPRSTCPAPPGIPTAPSRPSPSFRELRAASIPVAALDGGVTAKVIAGAIGGVQGPMRDIVIEPEMLDVSVPAGTVFRRELPAGHTAFAYVLSGEGYFDEARDPYAHETVGAGWYGPIVMNTQAELKTAFEEYEKGAFVK